MTLTIFLPDLAATTALGIVLARVLRPSDVVALEGDLGSGKTALARAIVQAMLGPEEEVPSPTFTLVQTYDMPSGETIWHFDLYRLDRSDDVFELGFEESLTEGIVLIEWPQRLGAYLPVRRLVVGLSLAGADEARLACLDGVGGGWRYLLDEVEQAIAKAG